jgi:hypothetical protein
MTRLSTFLIALALLSASCTGTPDIEIPEDIAAMENVAVFSGEAEPLYDITFTEEAKFGDTDEVFIGSISGIAADENGNVFMADGREATILVYDRNGNFRFTIGRRGEGPGEFNSVYRPKLYNGHLYVLDVQQQRVSVFDPENGEFIRNIAMGGGGQDFNGFPLSMDPLSEGRFLVSYNTMERDGERYLRTYVPAILDNEGEKIESGFVEFRPGVMHMMQSENSIQIMSLPYLGESVFDITSKEELVWGFTDRVFLQFLSLNGEYIRSIYHSRVNPPLDRQEMLANYEDEAMRNSIRNLGIPDVRQAFQQFKIDDENRIWISLTTGNRDENEWWVLAETGEKLAAFTRPTTDRIDLVKDGNAYFRETDEETGLVEVVKYRFDL